MENVPGPNRGEDAAPEAGGGEATNTVGAVHPPPPEESPRERLERLDREEAKRPPDPRTWADEPDDLGLTSVYWDDPEPDFHGMLTGDRIRAYHYAMGRMIRPFQEEHLKPASYELTLGPRYLIDGKEGYLTSDNPVLTIPPNSIVYVSMRELLLLPHWLVARFNLAIDFIYQGLLLGTGPQVDPGFKGVLACPLHNISSRHIKLTYCEPFAKMDFVKTSWVADVDASDIADEGALYAAVDAGTLRGYQEEALKVWKRTKNFRSPIFFIPASREVNSSVRQLDDRVQRYTSRVQLAGAGGVLVGSGLIAAVVGLFMYGLSYTDGKVEDVRADRAEQSQSPRQLRQQLRDTRVVNERLQRQVRQLQRNFDRLRSGG